MFTILKKKGDCRYYYWVPIASRRLNPNGSSGPPRSVFGSYKP
jgi:hypothetical protein